MGPYVWICYTIAISEKGMDERVKKVFDSELKAHEWCAKGVAGRRYYRRVRLE